jgi:hypothetical protein
MMGRKNKQKQVTDAVQDYLENAGNQTPDEAIINVKSVAAVLGVSRTSLYKYGLDSAIKAAAKRQRERMGLNESAAKRRRASDIALKLRADLHLAEERNKGLVAQICLIEANAARLGIDPEELYQPLAKPVRSVSHAGRGYKTRQLR